MLTISCFAQNIKALRDELSRSKAEHRAEFESKLGYGNAGSLLLSLSGSTLTLFCIICPS